MKQRYTYRIDDHKTATVERFSGNWYIYIYKDGEYTNEVLKCMDIEEAERFLRRQRPTAERISDTMEHGNALEEKEENTMKKYTVKAEYADQIFGSAESSYVEECMQNGMPEEDVMHLVREWGPEVLEQFDIEDIPMTVYGRAISDKDMQAIGSYMDDDIREDLHCDLAPCTHEEFIAAYLEKDPEFENLLRAEFNFKREV